MNKQRKIELLEDYIQQTQYLVDAIKHHADPSLISQLADAKEWLAKIQADNDGWVKIENGLPEINKVVWLYNKNDKQQYHGDCQIGYFDGENWMYRNGYVAVPTHWKPITPPTS